MAVHMETVRRAAVVIGVGLTLAACKSRNGSGDAAARDTTIHSADTSVVNRTVQDTLIVRHDTSVRVDTVRKRGGVVDSSAKRPH